MKHIALANSVTLQNNSVAAILEDQLAYEKHYTFVKHLTPKDSKEWLICLLNDY